MSYFATLRATAAKVQVQAARADSAEARALVLEAALSELTRAVGTCKMSSEVTANAVRHSYINGHPLRVRAPHDQDPRVQSALAEARTLLGRAL